MTHKSYRDNKSLLILTVLLLVGVANTTNPRRTSRSKASPLTDWQKQYLEKIQLAAKEGGLEEAEWKGITKYDKDVCYERPCLDSALEIMQATNFTVDPCQPNMWLAYACERRVTGVDNINQPERLMKKVEGQTKMILGNDLISSKHYLLKEAQVYYRQCKNSHLHDKKDVKDILSYLTENYGEWPMLTNRDPGPNFNWFEMVADLNRIERPGFSPALLKVDVKAESRQIQLNVGKIMFPITQSDFEKMMIRVQEKSGRKRPARLDQLAAVQTFMNSVNQAVLQKPANKQAMTIDQLQSKTEEMFPNISENIKWLEFFQKILNGSDIRVTGSEPLLYLPFNQIMAVVNTIQSESDPKPVANALNFQFAILLLQESTNLLNDLNSFKCTEESGNKEDICYARTIEIFGYSLGKTYLDIFYNKDVETPAIQALMVKIQQGYVDVIEDTKWMENSTKEYLKDKVNSMKTYITEPEWTKDPKKMRKFYKRLEATASKDMRSLYPRNYLAVTSWEVAKKRGWAHKISKVTRLKDIQFYDSEWSRYLGNVQAQYHKGINQARIEGGIVRSPLFGADRPGLVKLFGVLSFMNFGGLGMVLGHEIGHSFDVQGRTYNKDGENTKEYWDPKSVEMYNKWTETILQDYSSEAHQTSETSAETIDGQKTLNEDISDILGIYISYFSYQEYLQDLEDQGKKEKILPGLKSFEPQKLFYMKYANMWCDKKDVQDRFNDMLQSHSPGNIRATLPLKRSKEFADTFGCEPPEEIKLK